MLRTVGAVVAALGLAALALGQVASADTLPIDDPTGLIDPPAAAPGFRAGFGMADATWHVGAGAGQYAEKNVPTTDGGDVDPQQHSLAQSDSYGVASRLSIRAIVLEGANGRRIALVKSDNYLAQNHLVRRAAQLLQLAGSSLAADDIVHSASHNHNSPYYSTPSWGVWLFQDVFDLRAFEYQARAMRDAILAAEADLEPAVMGATTVDHDVFKGMIAETGVAEDGTPFGYPADFGDLGVTVLRFDALDGSPIAAWASWGQHPESLDGSDLITADFLGPLERFVERETGAPLVFSQADVGSAEGPYYPRAHNPVLPDGVVKAWAHVGHAQMERGARYLADAVIAGWTRIGAGESKVPLSSDVPVDLITYWAPGPVSHPYPSVSNCRSEPTVEGDPGTPLAKLPDCDRDTVAAPNFDSPVETETAKESGIPVPDHYGVPAFGAVQENLRIQLQAVRIGDVVLGSCSCEAQADLVLNFESRANDVTGDIWDGYPWDETCVANGDGTWTCDRPRGGETTVTDAAYQRMKAQIHNDAAGWDDPAYAPYANSEPLDPSEIKGNFTKEELDADTGYAIAAALGSTGDYIGYVVTYRQYQSGDYYRKALTAYGPHTADYLVTRLVRMARAMRTGEPFTPADPLTPAAAADEARQEATSQALGRAAGAAYDAWQAALAPDLEPAALTQPADITRFDAATFTWRGGSNAVDNPIARVERLVAGEWVGHADASGEVQTMLDMPDADEQPAARAGGFEWRWTAGFEAFTGWPAPLGQTPAGTYRFVVDGERKAAVGVEPYTLVSAPFAVRPWDGVRLAGLAVEDGDVTFTTPTVPYPRTYRSVFRYVRDDGNPTLCRTCSFRPWARTAEVASVTVTVLDGDGAVIRTVDAVADGERWLADTDLVGDEIARVEVGAATDVNGEVNGMPYVIAADGSTPEQIVGGAGTSVDHGAGPLVPIASTGPSLPIAVAAALALVLMTMIGRKALA